MNNDSVIKILSNEQMDNLFNISNNLIRNTFVKLNIKDQILLTKYLFKTIIIFYIYFYNQSFYEYFIEQITMNNCQDIYGILILLLPFYDLNKSKELEYIDELIINKNE